MENTQDFHLPRHKRKQRAICGQRVVVRIWGDASDCDFTRTNLEHAKACRWERVKKRRKTKPWERVAAMVFFVKDIPLCSSTFFSLVLLSAKERNLGSRRISPKKTWASGDVPGKDRIRVLLQEVVWLTADAFAARRRHIASLRFPESHDRRLFFWGVEANGMLALHTEGREESLLGCLFLAPRGRVLAPNERPGYTIDYSECCDPTWSWVVVKENAPRPRRIHRQLKSKASANCSPAYKYADSLSLDGTQRL